MKKYSKETTVGIFVVIGLMAIGYLTINLGDVSFLGDNTYPLYARFSSVTGLRAGSVVNMLGLEVGKVGSLTIDQEKQQAVVELRIRKGIKVYDDAIAYDQDRGVDRRQIGQHRRGRLRGRAQAGGGHRRHPVPHRPDGAHQQVCIRRC